MLLSDPGTLTAIIGPPRCGKTWVLNHAARATEGAHFVLWSAKRHGADVARAATPFNHPEPHTIFGSNVTVKRVLLEAARSYFFDDYIAQDWRDLTSLATFAEDHKVAILVTIASCRLPDGTTTSRKTYERLAHACQNVWAFDKSHAFRVACLKGSHLGGVLQYATPPKVVDPTWMRPPPRASIEPAWALLLRDPFA